MVYLDILIGFSLVMLVFASAVSVVQSALKRTLAIKGKALSRPLLAEIEREWAMSPRLGALDDEHLDHVRRWIRRSMTSRSRALGKTLRTLPVAEGPALFAVLRAEGGTMLAHLQPEHRAEWESLVDRIEGRWGDLQARFQRTYEQHTRRWILVLSALAVASFNVDAIRILRVLSIAPQTRGELSRAADAHIERGPDKLPETLSDWQKENFAEIAASGLPLGWDKAALAICRYPDGAYPGLEAEGRLWDVRCHHRPDMRRSLYLSIWLWLVRLLGLLVGAGLIAQGAPFWYAVLDSVFGLKRRGDQAGAPALKSPIARAAVTGGYPAPVEVAAAGGESQTPPA
jgi:hypothetical protein